MNAHPHGEQLSAYLDGMLDVAKTRLVAAHLSDCTQCLLTLNELRETKELLRFSAIPSAPSPDFWVASYRRLRVEESQPKASSLVAAWGALRQAFREPQRRWSVGLAAAVLAAAVAVPLTNLPTFDQRPAVSLPASTLPDSVDVATLVQAHAESAAHQPLADPDRQDVIAMDSSFAPQDTAEAAGDLLDPGSDASP